MTEGGLTILAPQKLNRQPFGAAPSWIAIKNR